MRLDLDALDQHFKLLLADRDGAQPWLALQSRLAQTERLAAEVAEWAREVPGPLVRPEFPDGGPLTRDEHSVVHGLGQVFVQLSRIVGDGSSRQADLDELVGHVHALQNAVLAQAAARAYPDAYRLMGGSLRPVGELITAAQPDPPPPATCDHLVTLEFPCGDCGPGRGRLVDGSMRFPAGTQEVPTVAPYSCPTVPRCHDAHTTREGGWCDGAHADGDCPVCGKHDVPDDLSAPLGCPGPDGTEPGLVGVFSCRACTLGDDGEPHEDATGRPHPDGCRAGTRTDPSAVHGVPPDELRQAALASLRPVQPSECPAPDGRPHALHVREVRTPACTRWVWCDGSDAAPHPTPDPLAAWPAPDPDLCPSSAERADGTPVHCPLPAGHPRVRSAWTGHAYDHGVPDVLAWDDPGPHPSVPCRLCGRPDRDDRGGCVACTALRGGLRYGLAAPPAAEQGVPSAAGSVQTDGSRTPAVAADHVHTPYCDTSCPKDDHTVPAAFPRTRLTVEFDHDGRMRILGEGRASGLHLNTTDHEVMAAEVADAVRHLGRPPAPAPAAAAAESGVGDSGAASLRMRPEGTLPTDLRPVRYYPGFPATPHLVLPATLPAACGHCHAAPPRHVAPCPALSGAVTAADVTAASQPLPRPAAPLDPTGAPCTVCLPSDTGRCTRCGQPASSHPGGTA